MICSASGGTPIVSTIVASLPLGYRLCLAAWFLTLLALQMKMDWKPHQSLVRTWFARAEPGLPTPPISLLKSAPCRSSVRVLRTRVCWSWTPWCIRTLHGRIMRVSALTSWRISDRPSRLLLYTDGSFCHRRHKSSWAVAVFADGGTMLGAGQDMPRVPCHVKALMRLHRLSKRSFLP